MSIAPREPTEMEKITNNLISSQSKSIEELEDCLSRYVEVTARILNGKPVREYDHLKCEAERLLIRS